MLKLADSDGAVLPGLYATMPASDRTYGIPERTLPIPALAPTAESAMRAESDEAGSLHVPRAVNSGGRVSAF